MPDLWTTREAVPVEPDVRGFAPADLLLTDITADTG
jgi:hypothetical protein